MLDAGADLNSKDPEQVIDRSYHTHIIEPCLLQRAIQRGTPGVPFIKLLIERGVEMYDAVDNQETLIHHIFSREDYHVSGLHRKHRPG